MFTFPKGTKLPGSYVEPNRCATCTNVFVVTDYDSSPEYYCHVDKSERPKCGSVAMGEVLNYTNGKEISRLEMRMWDEWSDARRVDPSGCCKQYAMGTEG